ncbi:MAG: CHAT domain-containing protein [Cyanobacteria bacterium P01_F01_bin.150]
MKHGLGKHTSGSQPPLPSSSQPETGNRLWRLWLQYHPEPESLDGIPSETLGTRSSRSTRRKGRALARWMLFGLWFILGWILVIVLAGRSPLLHALPTPDHPSASVPSSEIASNSPQASFNQGIQAFQSERFAEAIAHWHQALVPTSVPHAPLHHALILNNLSLAHQHLGQWSNAETTLTQSLEILEQELETFDEAEASSGPASADQKSWNYYGKALNTHGWFYWRQGQPEQALEAWQQATSAYKTAQFVSGILGSQINQARALQSLGLSVAAKETLEHVQQQMDGQPDSAAKAIALQSLGNALRRVGALAESRDRLIQSLAISDRQSHANAQLQPQAQPQIPPTTASAQPQSSGLQSAIYLDLGNTEQALWERAVALNLEDDIDTHQQLALAYYQQAEALAPSILPRAQALANRLSFTVAMQGAIADANTRGSRSRASATGPTWDDLQGLWHPLAGLFDELPLGRAGLEIKLHSVHSLLTAQARLIPVQDLPDTLQSDLEQILMQVLEQSRQLQDGRTASLAMGQLGRLYEHSQRWDNAHQATLEAITFAEPIQAEDLRYRWEWQMGRILMAQGRQQAAIQSLEEAVKTLAEVRQDLLYIDADAQFSFRDDVEPLYRQLIDVLLRDLDAPQQNLRRATELVDALQLAELENYLGCNIDPLQLTDNVIDPNAAIVYPIILDNPSSEQAGQRLEVILQIPDQPLHRSQVEMSQDNIEALITQLSRTLPNRIRWRTAQQAAGQLYDMLIRPFDAILADTADQQITTLVFVADGSLRKVPMSVLWDREQDQYLLERYAIATAPSLQVVAPHPLSYPLKVLMAGASESMIHPFSDQPFTPLPNVKTELDTIQSLQQSGVLQTDLLFNEAFNQSNIKQKLQQQSFSIVHLATHGEFSSDLDRTFIASSDRPIFAEDLDQLLRSQDPGDDSIELLVLSACETATGDNRATLGLAGLTVRAGVRSTLATLWSVDDEATAVVMEEFYRQLVNHPQYSRAEALRQAQLTFWERGAQQGRDWKRPYFWSPFVLVGNWL